MKKNMLISLAMLGGLGVTTAIAEEMYAPWFHEDMPVTGNPVEPMGMQFMLSPVVDRPTNTLSAADRLKLEGELKAARLKIETLRSEYQAQIPTISMNKFEGSVTVEQKKVIASAKDLAVFRKIVTPKTDITTPYGEYTLLMQVGSLDAIEYLVNECHADVNEAVWQPTWGHYVTALDCFTYSHAHSPSPVSASIIAFLTSKQVNAKTAGQLGFWSNYFGDYVVNAQILEIQKRLALEENQPKELMEAIKEVRELEFKLGYFNFRPGQYRGPVRIWERRGPIERPMNRESGVLAMEFKNDMMEVGRPELREEMVEEFRK